MGPQLQQVFGVSREPVLSYVQRNHVDAALKLAVQGTRQIVIYGSSKQGKTAVLDRHIEENARVVVHCSPATTLGDIYRSILRRQKVSVLTEISKESSVGNAVGGGAKFKAMLPIVGGDISNSESVTSSYSETHTSAPIEFNLEVAQDVAEILLRLPKKFYVLENFHYLTEDVQHKLAFDLRTFEEMGIRFIILGVWREGNRLSQYNGDLQDRVSEVPVEPWEEGDFRRVVQKGEEKLNIKFSDDVIKNLIEKSHGSIGVLQELLKKLCEVSGVMEKCNNLKLIDNMDDLEAAVKIKIDEYASRHIRSLDAIAAGGRSTRSTEEKVALYLPYYFVQVMLRRNYRELKDGIERGKLVQLIQFIHPRPENVRVSDVSGMLTRLSNLQEKAKIVPPLFDFDRGTRRVKIIDSTLYFFIDCSDPDEVGNEILHPEPDPDQNYDLFELLE